MDSEGEKNIQHHEELCFIHSLHSYVIFAMVERRSVITFFFLHAHKQLLKIKAFGGKVENKEFHHSVATPESESCIVIITINIEYIYTIIKL